MLSEQQQAFVSSQHYVGPNSVQITMPVSRYPCMPVPLQLTAPLRACSCIVTVAHCTMKCFKYWEPCLMLTMMHRPHVHQPWRLFRCDPFIHSFIHALCPQAKKVTRHLQKSAAGGHGYTNAENPFGDANVTQRFVWGKKIEKQLQEGADVRDLTARAERERQVERLVRAPPRARRRCAPLASFLLGQPAASLHPPRCVRAAAYGVGSMQVAGLGGGELL